MMKMDGIPVWILKLLPTEHLRSARSCRLLEHNHLNRSRDITAFSYADDAKNRIWAFVYDEVLRSIGLGAIPRSLACEAEERKSRWLIHLRVVGCSIDSIGTTPGLEKTIHKIIRNSERT